MLIIEIDMLYIISCEIFSTSCRDNYVIRFCDGSFILIIEIQDFYARFSMNCRNWIVIWFCAKFFKINCRN